jgi:hypothetical protein
MYTTARARIGDQNDGSNNSQRFQVQDHAKIFCHKTITDGSHASTNRRGVSSGNNAEKQHQEREGDDPVGITASASQHISRVTRGNAKYSKIRTEHRRTACSQQ